MIKIYLFRKFAGNKRFFNKSDLKSPVKNRNCITALELPVALKLILWPNISKRSYTNSDHTEYLRAFEK
jgi:hypothetical protein